MTKTEDNPMHLKTGEPSRLRQAPRCLAQTRRGTPCQSPAVAGKIRCRMHGGAAGSGAPKGKRNGKYRNGGFTTEAIDERRRLASLIRDSRERAAAPTDAALTAWAMRWFTEMQAGRTDHSQYSAAYAEQVTDDAVKGMSAALNRYGASPLRAEIVQTRKIDEQKFYVVKFVFPRGDAIAGD